MSLVYCSLISSRGQYLLHSLTRGSCRKKQYDPVFTPHLARNRWRTEKTMKQKDTSKHLIPQPTTVSRASAHAGTYTHANTTGTAGAGQASRRVPGWVLLPLRLFLGITFVYAGLEKLTDPHYFDLGAAGSIGIQIQSFALGSPLHD